MGEGLTALPFFIMPSDNTTLMLTTPLFIEEFYNQLIDIAQNDGECHLIDSEFEISLVIDLLEKSYVLNAYSMTIFTPNDFSNEIDFLANHPTARLQIHFGALNYPTNNYPLCDVEGQQDCFLTFSALEPLEYAKIAIHTGANHYFYTDYYGLAEEQWEAIIAPFHSPSQTAEEEREKILQTLLNFQNTFAPDDIPGDAGNSVGERGQQNCIQMIPNAMTVFHFLWCNGYLHFHEFNIKRATAYALNTDDTIMHCAPALQDTEGNGFVFEIWDSEPQIMDQWSWVKKYQFGNQFRLSFKENILLDVPL